MKKAIICLGMLVMTFTGSALAAELQSNDVEVREIRVNGTPLCFAIIKGDTDVVKKFIEYGADVNETSRGMTPLMYAAHYNQKEIVNLLIAKGANVNLKDERGRTALDYAKEANAREVAGILIEAAKK